MANIIQQFLQRFEKRSSLYIFVSLFVILYGGAAAPNLPDFVKDLFDHEWFKLIVLSLIAFSANNDIKSSVMIALAFMLTLQAVTDKKVKENNDQVENYVKYL